LPAESGEAFPYAILDARYERIREAGVIASQAVAVAVDWEGRRQVLAVELANRESRSSWKEFLLALKRRGLSGVEYGVSDDHPGLKAAIREVLPEAAWQRCYVHFLQNALDYVPRKVDDDCTLWRANSGISFISARVSGADLCSLFFNFRFGGCGDWFDG
jgi:putative transposase